MDLELPHSCQIWKESLKRFDLKGKFIPPLAEAVTNCIRKTKKNVLWKASTGICPITEILWNTASHNISLKLDNRAIGAAELWPQTNI